jgi:hypothetical protein
MMEAASTSETSVNFHQSARCNIPEDSYPHNRCRENLKSHLINSLVWTQNKEEVLGRTCNWTIRKEECVVTSAQHFLLPAWQVAPWNKVTGPTADLVYPITERGTSLPNHYVSSDFDSSVDSYLTMLWQLQSCGRRSVDYFEVPRNSVSSHRASYTPTPPKRPPLCDTNKRLIHTIYKIPQYLKSFILNCISLGSTYFAVSYFRTQFFSSEIRGGLSGTVADFSPANHHSTTAPYLSITAPRGVR